MSISKVSYKNQNNNTKQTLSTAILNKRIVIIATINQTIFYTNLIIRSKNMTQFYINGIKYLYGIDFAIDTTNLQQINYISPTYSILAGDTVEILFNS